MRRRDVLSLVGAAGTLMATGGLGLSVRKAFAADTYTMAAIPKLRSPWFNQFEKGLLQAAEDFGIEAYQQAPSSADEAAQARLIEVAVNQGINALLIVPNDAQSVVPVLKRAQDRNIVTLTHESPAQRNADFDVEMIDNTAFGRKSMDVLAEAIGPEGGDFVIYVGSLTVPAHNIWADAALAQAKENYPNLKLLADRYPVSEDQSAARQTGLDILTTHPTVKGFLCFGSQGAPGASQAVGEKELNGKVAVVGTTSPNQASQYLKDGSMSAVILWDPGEAAYAMVYLAKLVLDGKKDQINADLDIPKIGKPLSIDGNTLVYDRPLIVTKENVDEHASF